MPAREEKLITDIPLIGRYSRHNEAQDYRFRTYLKSSPMSEATLDTVVQEYTADVWSKIDCLACGNCCKTMQIVVDKADIARLSKRLGMKPKAFADKYVQSGEYGDKVFKSTPCAFLGEGNRCSVYEDRPQACRDFPYLHKGFRSRTLMMISNCATCPIVFNVWQRLKAHFWPKRR